MVENLANLDKIPASGAMVIFAPLKIEGGYRQPGSCVRFLSIAIAIVATYA